MNQGIASSSGGGISTTGAGDVLLLRLKSVTDTLLIKRSVLSLTATVVLLRLGKPLERGDHLCLSSTCHEHE
ncbi:hypothetical protein, partial [Bosea sp. TAB14]|uniref:hypothetical protein n=1 Tax=Bosea sp. TAB14 TaxID=3237481 RepID=UPI003F92EB72